MPHEPEWADESGDLDLGTRLDGLDLESDDPLGLDNLPHIDWLQYQSPAFYLHHGLETPGSHRSTMTRNDLDDNDYDPHDNDIDTPMNDDQNNEPLLSAFSPPSPPDIPYRPSSRSLRTFPSRSRSSSLPSLPEVNEMWGDHSVVQKRRESAPPWQSRYETTEYLDLGNHDWTPERQAPLPPLRLNLNEMPGRKYRKTAEMLREAIHGPRPSPSPIASEPLSPEARTKHVEEMEKKRF